MLTAAPLVGEQEATRCAEERGQAQRRSQAARRACAVEHFCVSDGVSVLRHGRSERSIVDRGKCEDARRCHILPSSGKCYAPVDLVAPRSILNRCAHRSA